MWRSRLWWGGGVGAVVKASAERSKVTCQANAGVSHIRAKGQSGLLEPDNNAFLLFSAVRCCYCCWYGTHLNSLSKTYLHLRCRCDSQLHPNSPQLSSLIIYQSAKIKTSLKAASLTRSGWTTFERFTFPSFKCTPALRIKGACERWNSGSEFNPCT